MGTVSGHRHDCRRAILMFKPMLSIARHPGHVTAITVMSVALISVFVCLATLTYEGGEERAQAELAAETQALSSKLIEEVFAPLEQQLKAIGIDAAASDISSFVTSPYIDRWPGDPIGPGVLNTFSISNGRGRILYARNSATGAVATDEKTFLKSLTMNDEGVSGQGGMTLGVNDSRSTMFAASPLLDERGDLIAWITTRIPVRQLEAVVTGSISGTYEPVTVRLLTPHTELVHVSSAGGPLVTNSDAPERPSLYYSQPLTPYPITLVTTQALKSPLTRGITAGFALVLLAATLGALQYVLRRRPSDPSLPKALVPGQVLDATFAPPAGIVKVQSTPERQAMEPARLLSDTHDPVTGLPNRKSAEMQFQSALVTGVNELVFLTLDVDHFTHINDPLGDRTGGAVLKALGDRLKRACPDSEIVSKLDGDEFLVVSSTLNHINLPQTLKGLVAAFRQPILIDTYRLDITTSIGIATYPSNGQDFASVLKAASTARNQAKASGGNAWFYYAEEMRQRGLRRLQMQMDLHEAFEQEKLQIFYQPQIDASSGSIVGAEALLRWRHPLKGDISPAEFIPIAESAGLIIDIGNWVLRAVCLQLASWQNNGMNVVPVAVNCSALHLRNGNLADEIQRALEQSGINPCFLELELTESIFIDDVEETGEIAKRLKRLGIRLAIDDFGTGYSSMAYLKRFDVNKLKIDRMFVDGILENPQDAAIVRSIIELSHSLGMVALAEGVETRDVLQALERMGCDQIQGYYFAKPVNATDFEVFIKSAHEIDTMMRSTNGVRSLEDRRQA